MLNPLTLIQKIIGGGLLTALLAVSIYAGIQKLESSHWRKEYDRESVVHRQDNDNWIAAQALANARATSAKLAAEARFASIKAQSEKDYAALHAADDARLAQWVRTHRANQAPARQSDLPGAPGSAQQPDGPDTVVTVDAGVLAVCTTNTRRLMNAREWALNIQGAGK